MKQGLLDESQESFEDVAKEAEEVKKAVVPTPMPAAGHTLEFPRRDNMYKKKESLPYDEVYSNVWKSRPRDYKGENCRKWLVFAMAGFLIGVTAFLMSQLEDFLVDHNRELLQYIINDY